MKTTAQQVNRKKIDGTVVSDKMQKTVTVLVKRYVKHPKYQKFVIKTKKIKAHNEGDVAKTGDKVVIESCRPISRDKTFTILAINGKKI